MRAFKNFRTYFFRGLAALLPTIVTIWIFVQCYLFIQNNVSTHINRGMVRLFVSTVEWYPYITDDEKVAYVLEKEPSLRDDQAAIEKRIRDKDVIYRARIGLADRYWVTGPGQITGFIIALIGVCFIGAFLASFIGKAFWRIFEKALMKAPFVKKIYPYIKQITDFILTKKSLSFNKVVGIQYPRNGVWSVALVTGNGLKKIVNAHNREFLTVFVPSSPTPFTGYVIMTPKDETIELDMTIEEALRFTVSGGVITPAEQEAFEALTKSDKDSSV